MQDDTGMSAALAIVAPLMCPSSANASKALAVLVPLSCSEALGNSAVDTGTALPFCYMGEPSIAVVAYCMPVFSLAWSLSAGAPEHIVLGQMLVSLLVQYWFCSAIKGIRDKGMLQEFSVIITVLHISLTAHAVVASRQHALERQRAASREGLNCMYVWMYHPAKVAAVLGLLRTMAWGGGLAARVHVKQTVGRISNIVYGWQLRIRVTGALGSAAFRIISIWLANNGVWEIDCVYDDSEETLPAGVSVEESTVWESEAEAAGEDNQNWAHLDLLLDLGVDISDDSDINSDVDDDDDNNFENEHVARFLDT